MGERALNCLRNIVGKELASYWPLARNFRRLNEPRSGQFDYLLLDSEEVSFLDAERELGFGENLWESGSAVAQHDQGIEASQKALLDDSDEAPHRMTQANHQRLGR
jgi:hypothetical protein